MKNTKKFIFPVIIVALAVGFFIWKASSFQSVSIPNTPADPTPVTPDEPTPSEPAPSEPTTPVTVPEVSFSIVTLSTTRPGAELTKLVGRANVAAVLALNRIDDKYLWQGMTITIPSNFDNPDAWAFMPTTIDAASSIPKLVLVSQRTQSFGFYENGTLVRSGPVSSGKKTTPTPSKLYFMNWKGKEVISTFSDEWVLKWNFNVDNNEGIGLHYYGLPGYPASHSCVRFYEADAEFLYNWADQWVLDKATGQKKLASGTPVIIFGEYNFAKAAPWKQLVTKADATTVPKDEVETLVTKNLAKIQSEQALREQVLNQQ